MIRQSQIQVFYNKVFKPQRRVFKNGDKYKEQKSEGKFYSEPHLKIYHNYYQILLDIITVNYYQKYRY